MICAVVLAAGRSERMGTQKLLLPLGAKPVIARIGDELLHSPLQQIVVVVGRDGERIQQALLGSPERGVHAASRAETGTAAKSFPTVPGKAALKRAEARAPVALSSHPFASVTFVHNPDSEGDMLGSVRCGLRALPVACEAVLVVLGDQPGITRELVGELIRAHHKSNCDIIVPAHGGRRGHPLLFAARYREEVLSRYDGVGLHGLLAAHPNKVLEVEVPSAAVLEDLDTPEDYQRFAHRELAQRGADRTRSSRNVPGARAKLV